MNATKMKPPEPDAAFEISLRPPMFSEFTGQVKVRERLELMVEAAKKRRDVLEHILLSGPSGLGKTTLAYIIANAMGVNVKNTSGPVIEKAGELAGLLTSLEKGDVLFIDEIHRLQPTIEEYLYPAMEDYRLDIIIDQGPQARSLRLQLPKFTLVGATTRAGMVSAPLRSRFGMTARLDYYAADEMQKIITRSARLLGVEIDGAGAAEIAARARGTPRTANNLLRWVRDYVQVKAQGKITGDLADKALAMLEIDRDGFDQWDKRIIETLIHKFNAGGIEFARGRGGRRSWYARRSERALFDHGRLHQAHAARPGCDRERLQKTWAKTAGRNAGRTFVAALSRYVMSTEVETSLNSSQIVRDSSTALGMTKTHAPCR